MNLTDVIFVEDLIVLVFRLINFLILLALLGYGFKRYGLSTLQEAYQAYHGYFDHLFFTHARLLDESNHMDRMQEKNQQEQELLKERLLQWKSAVDSYNERVNQKSEKQLIERNDRLKIQQEKIREYRLKTQVVPLAFADARKRLIELAATKEFQDEITQKSKILLRKVHR